MGRLQHKAVVITGGAQGLGASIAEMCVKEGANVILLDVDPRAPMPERPPFLTARARRMSATLPTMHKLRL